MFEKNHYSHVAILHEACGLYSDLDQAGIKLSVPAPASITRKGVAVTP